MNERINVTVALSVTVDPESWYSRFDTDPGIDIPDRMLSHLRILPGIREVGGKVRLRRLIRRGSRHCRQSAQHRGIAENPVYELVRKTLTLPRPDQLGADHLTRLCQHMTTQTMHLIFPGRRIPNEPSADFL